MKHHSLKPWITFFILLNSLQLSAQHVEDAVNWIKTTYAPLWPDVETVDPAKVSEAYAVNFHEYDRSGNQIVHENTVEHWQELVRMYKANGWRAGKLQEIGAYALNDTNVILEVSWMQTMESGEILDCYTYHLIGGIGAWKIANTTFVDCAEQKMKKLYTVKND